MHNLSLYIIIINSHYIQQTYVYHIYPSLSIKMAISDLHFGQECLTSIHFFPKLKLKGSQQRRIGSKDASHFTGFFDREVVRYRSLPSWRIEDK